MDIIREYKTYRLFSLHIIFAYNTEYLEHISYPARNGGNPRSADREEKTVIQCFMHLIADIVDIYAFQVIWLRFEVIQQENFPRIALFPR